MPQRHLRASSKHIKPCHIVVRWSDLSTFTGSKVMTQLSEEQRVYLNPLYQFLVQYLRISETSKVDRTIEIK
jgi:hypothetical protein